MKTGKATYLFGLWLPLLIALGCTEQSPSPGENNQWKPMEERDVKFAGCETVKQGPVCEYSTENPIKIWLHSRTSDHPTILVDGVTKEAEFENHEGGIYSEVTISKGARLLRLEAKKTSHQEFFEIQLSEYDPPSWFKEASELKRTSNLPEALSLIAPFCTSEDPLDRARALGLKGRIHLAKGEYAQAKSALKKAIQLNRDLSISSEFSADSLTLAFMLTYRLYDLSEARALLEDLENSDYTDDFTEAILPHYRGILFFTAGDSKSALESAEKALKLTSRLKLMRHHFFAEDLYASALQSLGHYKRAFGTLLRPSIDEKELSGCELADRKNQIGWLAYLTSTSDNNRKLAQQTLPNAKKTFQEALDQYSDDCNEPARLVNVLTNLTLACIHEKDWAEAKEHLERAEAIEPHPPTYILLWQHEARAVLAEQDGELSKALSHYQNLNGLAEAVLSLEARLRALTGAARILTGLGREKEAEKAFEKAQRLIDEEGVFSPVLEGRRAFFERAQKISGQYVRHLVNRGNDIHAATVARKNRVRLLAPLYQAGSLESVPSSTRSRYEHHIAEYLRSKAKLEKMAETSWSLASDELSKANAEVSSLTQTAKSSLLGAMQELTRVGIDRFSKWSPPAPSEHVLYLITQPLDDTVITLGWLNDTVLHHVTPTSALKTNSSMLAKELLDPFSELISSAESIAILPAGRTEAVDYHTLIWNGAPLIDHLPVFYAIDLPTDDSKPRQTQESKKKPPLLDALVVGDPRGNLAASRKEAESVASLFKSKAGGQVRMLIGQDATPTALKNSISDAGWFHYSGHAKAKSDDIWDDSFLLASDTEFTVGDIVSLDKVPPTVFLSACESDASATETDHADLGLAPAFAVAGSSVVLATSRPVADRTTIQFATAYYNDCLQSPFSSEGNPPEKCLQNVIREYKAENPNLDWAAFRLLRTKTLDEGE